MSENVENHQEDSGSLIANRGDVTLKSIKIKLEKRTCEVAFSVTRRSDEGSKSYIATFKPDWLANDPLCDAIASLRDPMCKITNKREDKYSNVNVTSVSVNEIDSDKQGTFKICGTEKSNSEQDQNVATHAVKFGDGVYGIENDVKEAIDLIEGLAFDYIYQQESAQLTLGFSKAPLKTEADFKTENPSPEDNVSDAVVIEEDDDQITEVDLEDKSDESVDI